MSNEKTKDNQPQLWVYGDTGLKRSCGLIDEEFHTKLIGDKGRKIYREMADNEGVIGMSLWAWETLLRSASWNVEESESESELKEEAATLIDQVMHDMDSTWSNIMSEILSMVIFGWALLEPTYKIRRGEKTNFSLLNSEYDDGYFGVRDMPIRAQESLYKWEFTKEGEVIGMWQQPPHDYSLRFIPANRYINFRIKARKGNPEGTSLLRSAYTSYYFAKRLREIEAIGIERNIAGMPVMEVPESIAHANSNTAEAAIRSRYVDFVKKVRTDTFYGAVVPTKTDRNNNPTGYALSLMSSSGRSFADTSPIIQRYEKLMTMILNTEFKYLGIEGVGSRAAHSDKTDFLGCSLNSVNDLIEDEVNNILIPRLMRLNGFPREAWPTWKHGDIEKKSITDTFNAINSAVGSGAMEVTEDVENTLRDLIDLPPKEGSPMRQLLLDSVTGQQQDPVVVDTDQVSLPLPEVAQEDSSGMLTLDEASDYLRINRSILMRALNNGQLPGGKIGRNWRIKQDDLNQYMYGQKAAGV